MNPPDDLAKSYFDTLLTATAAGNFEQFISVWDERSKTRFQPEAFHRVSQQLAPRMQQGFTPTFLGEMRQHGSPVSLWRLRFDDRGDDLLFRMSIAGNKVNGAIVAPAFS